MPRPIFDKLAKMPVRKLDLMELEHNRHYETFTRFKNSKKEKSKTWINDWRSSRKRQEGNWINRCQMLWALRWR